jgi:hypothetical protein
MKGGGWILVALAAFFVVPSLLRSLSTAGMRAQASGPLVDPVTAADYVLSQDLLHMGGRQ